jgi:hypothetical protein
MRGEGTVDDKYIFKQLSWPLLENAFNFHHNEILGKLGTFLQERDILGIFPKHCSNIVF